MKITIQKFDPTVDAEPYQAEYDVPKTEYMTVLEALVYIDENLEPLAYDYSCRGRCCGRCSLMLDGEPCTACTKSISDSDHIIEPLNGIPVIRDLVVDKHDMQDRISRISLRVRAEQLTVEDVEAPYDYAAYEKVDALGRCARCLVCNASCPVRSTAPGEYIGPSGMVAIANRHFDLYDEGERIIQAVQEGLWNCIMCGKCDEVCPCLEINHIETWNELREAATARGLTQKSGPLLPYSQ
jgi:fumarate reductase iron-sulfur subunit/fumarate reductase (CoM/CoB) subunit B